MMIYLDLFSGIGGFAKGLHDAGLPITKHYYSEIDKYCIQTYRKNFKDAINIGDISDVRGKRARIQRPNIITFGFPCQDLSIAGKRKGLDGKRSGLFFQAIRLIKKYRPEVFIFENVKGLLSSNGGKDFETVLRAIADLGIYECQWQLVNTTWVLPQNRERVYFIGYLAGRGSPTVFPFRQSDFTTDGISGQRVNAITTRTGGAESVGVYVVEDKFPSQIHRYSDTSTGGQRGIVVSDSGINPALSATQYKDPPKVAQLNNPKHSNDRVYSEDALSPSLNTMQGGNRQPFITQPLRWKRSEKGKKARKENKDGTDYTPFGQGHRELSTTDELVSGCITSATNKDSLLLDRHDIRKLTETESERLQGFPDGWTAKGIDSNGKDIDISSTQRYKQTGNAVTVDIVRLIGERILKDNILNF